MLENSNSVAIFGHVRPDGDCVGSTMGLYNYIKDNFPQIEATVFIECFPDSFRLLNGADHICNEYDGRKVDAAFLMDTPSFERIGAQGAVCFAQARFTCNIDHHISNPLNLCNTNIVEPEASSASEVLFYQLSKNKISKNTANSLYLGIVHDTGAFKFSCTSKRTMNAVGDLIDLGVDFTRIINETYYTRTYKQTLATGYVMQNSKLALNGKVVYSYITAQDMEKFGVSAPDLSNVIDTLREVSGTEVTIFLYPVNGKYKISLRSNYTVDVNAIAKEFGGGGHIRAAGGDTEMAPEEAIKKIVQLISKQL